MPWNTDNVKISATLVCYIADYVCTNVILTQLPYYEKGCHQIQLHIRHMIMAMLFQSHEFAHLCTVSNNGSVESDCIKQSKKIRGFIAITLSVLKGNRRGMLNNGICC